MRSDFFVIKGNDIQQFINVHYSEIYHIIRDTYLLHDKGEFINPNSYFLRFPKKPKNRIIALPAAIIDDKPVAGIKWISSYPDNLLSHSLARASAVIILNNYETGYPFACLEGSVISATRTACSAVLAAEMLNNKNNPCKRIGFIGNGLIAQYIFDCFIQQNWEFEQISLYDLQGEKTMNLKNYIEKDLCCSIKIFDSPERIVKDSDLIVFATTASQPYIETLEMFEHAPTILHISLRDIAPSVIFHSTNIVDDIEHVMSASTSIDLTQQYYQTKSFIHGTIAECINGKININHNKAKIFSPMGMGILDIAVARYIFSEIDNNKKYTISNFHSV